MFIRKGLLTLSLFSLFAAFGAAQAKTSCPAQVKMAIDKAYPDGKITSCKKEKEGAMPQYEVGLSTSSAKQMEINVSPEGNILKTGEGIRINDLPQSVTSGFGQKYPKAKLMRAMKLTAPDGKVTYELTYKARFGKRHEAEFGEDGKYIEKS